MQQEAPTPLQVRLVEGAPTLHQNLHDLKRKAQEHRRIHLPLRSENLEAPRPAKELRANSLMVHQALKGNPRIRKDPVPLQIYRIPRKKWILKRKDVQPVVPHLRKKSSLAVLAHLRPESNLLALRLAPLQARKRNKPKPPLAHQLHRENLAYGPPLQNGALVPHHHEAHQDDVVVPLQVPPGEHPPPHLVLVALQDEAGLSVLLVRRGKHVPRAPYRNVDRIHAGIGTITI